MNHDSVIIYPGYTVNFPVHQMLCETVQEVFIFILQTLSKNLSVWTVSYNNQINETRKKQKNKHTKKVEERLR